MFKGCLIILVVLWAASVPIAAHLAEYRAAGFDRQESQRFHNEVQQKLDYEIYAEDQRINNIISRKKLEIGKIDEMARMQEQMYQGEILELENEIKQIAEVPGKMVLNKKYRHVETLPKDIKDIYREPYMWKISANRDDIRAFAQKEVPSAWQTYNDLTAAIGNQNQCILLLHQELSEFGLIPEADEDFMRICKDRDDMIKWHKDCRINLENAFIAEMMYKASPTSKRDAISKCIQDAEMIQKHLDDLMEKKGGSRYE